MSTVLLAVGSLAAQPYGRHHSGKGARVQDGLREVELNAERCGASPNKMEIGAPIGKRDSYATHPELRYHTGLEFFDFTAGRVECPAGRFRNQLP